MTAALPVLSRNLAMLLLGALGPSTTAPGRDAAGGALSVDVPLVTGPSPFARALWVAEVPLQIFASQVTAAGLSVALPIPPMSYFYQTGSHIGNVLGPRARTDQ